MEHWSSADRRWERMDEGPAARVWRARPTAEDAIEKCRAWTGGIGIPAMQVIDEAGAVVWRDSSRYPDAGPSVLFALASPTGMAF